METKLLEVSASCYFKINKAVQMIQKRAGERFTTVLHISRVRKKATTKNRFFSASFLVVEHHEHNSGFVKKRRAPTENTRLVHILTDTPEILRQNV